jgi:hypothetical protein
MVTSAKTRRTTYVCSFLRCVRDPALIPRIRRVSRERAMRCSWLRGNLQTRVTPIHNETSRRILSGEITRREATFRSLFLHLIHWFPIVAPPIVGPFILPLRMEFRHLPSLFLSSPLVRASIKGAIVTEPKKPVRLREKDRSSTEKDWQPLWLQVNFRPAPSDSANAAFNCSRAVNNCP